jgi:hypothetical protein
MLAPTDPAPIALEGMESYCTRLTLVLLASLLPSYFSLPPSVRAGITIPSVGDASVKIASVVLTNAQIKALAVDGSNRPVVLVPAPAANQMIVPVQGIFMLPICYRFWSARKYTFVQHLPG